jgi:hypothetical protein
MKFCNNCQAALLQNRIYAIDFIHKKPNVLSGSVEGYYFVRGTVGVAEIPDSSAGRPVLIFHEKIPRGLTTG